MPRPTVGGRRAIAVAPPPNRTTLLNASSIHRYCGHVTKFWVLRRGADRHAGHHRRRHARPPRIPRPDPAVSTPRPVAKVITAHAPAEGAGFSIRRPFPGELSMAESDPFLLLDHVGPQVNAPDEAKGRRGIRIAASRP